MTEPRLSITEVTDRPFSVDPPHKYIETESERKELTIREKIYVFFDSPTSSKPAFLYSNFLISVILLSVVLFILETLPQYWANTSKGMFGLEAFCATIFTIDYIGRLLTVKKWYRWIYRPMTIVDLLSVLPFYLELIIEAGTSSLSIIRILRLLRIFRIFKVEKYSQSLRVISRTALGIREHMLLMVFSTLLGIIVLSSLVFFAEQTGQKFVNSQWIRKDGTESPFSSIIASFWYTMVTLTTVGYGDMFPVSDLGKTVGAVVVLSSILVLGFPISIVGERFLKEYEHSQKKQIKNKLIEEWRNNGLLKPGQSLGELLIVLDLEREKLKSAIESKTRQYEVLKRQYEELSEHIENLNHVLHNSY